jgi:hypothetical protein
MGRARAGDRHSRALVASALIIGAINRLLILGALFAIAGAVLNVLFFIEIARELVGKP